MRKLLGPSSSEQLTFWPEASLDHASPFQSPASKKGPKTSATYGPRCHESSAKSDPVGYLLRTYLASELSRLTSSSKTWKDRGTPAGRSWWVLMTSEPRTEGSAFGSSQDWGTPRVTTNGGRGNGERTKGSRLEDQACWPTPHGMQSDNPRMAGPTGNELGRAVTKQWPTPRAEDAEQNQAVNWQTPNAQDAENAGSPKRPALTAQARAQGENSAGLLAPENPNTHGKVHDCPTPRSSDATGGPDPTGEDGMRKQGTGPDLKAKVRDAENWPTPQAFDANDCRKSDEAMERAMAGRAIPGRNGGAPSNLREKVRGSLNPRWVSSLMGFPQDWLDTPPPTAEKRSKRSGTR